MSVRVVTDSSAVMPEAWARDYRLHVVPLQLAWRDGEVSSGDLPYQDFAARIAGGEPPPTTSAPSPGAYEALLEELLATDDEVLVVCPAAELSSTYSSAILAARTIGGEHVRALDARTAAAGQGIVAAMAARRAAQGADLDEVSDHALDVASEVAIWATLSRLDYLRRSGRVPSVAAVGAGAFGIQPIVRYTKGSPTPVGIVRNERRAVARLLRAWTSARREDGVCHTVAFHSARAGDAEELCTRIVAPGATVHAHAVEVTSSLAAHTGPGLLGLAWWWEGQGRLH